MAELLIAKGENDKAWQYANAAAKKASNTKEQSRALLLQQYLMY